MEGGVSSALLPFLALGMGPVSLCVHLWGYPGDARALSLSRSRSLSIGFTTVRICVPPPKSMANPKSAPRPLARP